MIIKILLVAVFLRCVFAGFTDEEIKIEFTKLIMKCTKQHPVEMSELLGLQALKVPTNRDTKCLLACAYKGNKWMNDKGLYEYDGNIELAKKNFGSDPKRLENTIKLIDTCVKVNNIKVSDGTKGCDRAALIFSCIVKSAPKLGFKI